MDVLPGLECINKHCGHPAGLEFGRRGRRPRHALLPEWQSRALPGRRIPRLYYFWKCHKLKKPRFNLS